MYEAGGGDELTAGVGAADPPAAAVPHAESVKVPSVPAHVGTIADTLCTLGWVPQQK